MKQTTPVDVAVIGAGVMGRRHVEVIRELGLRLVGICDVKPEALEFTREKFDLPTGSLYDDASTMLAETRPQCLIVATTASSHYSYTCLAAEYGTRFVLCEKPMAVSIEQCDKMIDVCRANQIRLAVNHPIRFMEHYREPKTIICSEAFGGLSSVTVVSGNCGISMNGGHYFEMFRYMTEEQPVEVMAWLTEQFVPNPRGSQYEDRAGSVRLTTASGKRLYLEIGADQGHGIKIIYAGRYGQLLVDELAKTMLLTLRQEQYRNMPTIRNGMPSVDTIHKIEPTGTIEGTREVLKALLYNGDPPSGETGRLAVQILAAAYMSHERRRPVRLDAPDLPIEQTFPWA